MPNDVATIATPLGKKFNVGVVAPQYHIGRSKSARQSVPVYDEKLIAFIAEMIKERPNKKFDCIVLITGPRRTGKSTLAVQIARKVDPHFDINHIAFRLDDFNEIIRTNPTANPAKGIYPQVILDEAGFDLFSQNWMQQVQKNLVRKFEVIGARNQIVYLVLPHRMMLNKGIREGMIHYWLNVSTFEQHRGFAELRKGYENLWKLEMYWKPMCAFTFNDVSDEMWKAYNVKKEAFIDEVTADKNITEGDPRATRYIRQRDAAIRLGYKRGVTTLDALAQATGLSRPQISEIISHEIEPTTTTTGSPPSHP